MNPAPDLGWLSLLAAGALIAIPLAVSRRLRLGLGTDMVVAAARMGLQLTLAGIYLRYLFAWDLWWLNLLWLLVMVATGALSVVRNSRLRWREMLLPALGSMLLAVLVTVAYFNTFIVGLSDLFSARYLVVIGGMLLGNSLSGNIIALTTFYRAAREEEVLCRAYRGAGAELGEALRPFAARALSAAFTPTIASMATMGIVSLPGMMTGQMLGGADPVTAVKYQIAIMLAIFANVSASAVIALWWTRRAAFDEYGCLRRGIYRD